MKLSQGEKGVICAVAREAYDAWPDRAEYERNAAPGLDAFTAWRHSEQLKAANRQSLTLCTGDDFRRLLDHFMRLRSEARVAAQTPSLF